MKKTLVIVSLLAALACSAQTFKGKDPQGESLPNWTHTQGYGYPFQFVPGFRYHYLTQPTNSLEASYWNTAVFTSNSVVNYKRNTVTLMVGRDHKGKEQYLSIERTRVAFFD